jgi:putative sigma-54 modulation protein
LRSQLARRLARIDRLLGESAVSAQVVLTQEKHRLITDLSLHARGDNVLSAVGAATSWPLSMREAVDKIEQQALTVKGKWVARKRRATGGKRLEPPAPVEPPPAPPVRTPAGPKIVRTRHVMRSFTPEEAAARVGDHTDAFVLFRDARSGGLALLYRRKDGKLGLVEPES